MEFLSVGQDLQRLFLERNHKEGSLLVENLKNSSRLTEPALSQIQARVEMIQMIADSSLASFLFVSLERNLPQVPL